jgi:hypothetical protein
VISDQWSETGFERQLTVKNAEETKLCFWVISLLMYFVFFVVGNVNS